MLDPQTHIYLELVLPEERHENVYMATPLSVFKKKPKNGTFARKKDGVRPKSPYIFRISVTRRMS